MTQSRERTKFWLKFGLATFLVLVILGYSLFQAQKIFYGPQIQISSPENGHTYSQSLIAVSGTSQNITRLRLNEKEISKDEQGDFAEKLLLSYGYNIIKVEGWDRFGRKTEKSLEVVYKWDFMVK